MPGKEKQILVATRNAGKVAELKELFGALPIEPVSLARFPAVAEIDETGSTFEENAVLKARGYAVECGLPALADDSGLEVAALGGRPGVYSARYGGEGLSYAEKIERLLEEIEASGSPDRSARFRAVIALARPDGEIAFIAEGECRGMIARAPRGTGGFGFDPVFIPEGYELTFAELPAEVKSSISHRGRAMEIIMQYLPDFIGV